MSHFTTHEKTHHVCSMCSIFNGNKLMAYPILSYTKLYNKYEMFKLLSIINDPKVNKLYLQYEAQLIGVILIPFSQ